MADIQLGTNSWDFTNSKKAIAGQDDTISVASPVNYTSIHAMKAALKTFDADTYTDEVLQQMNSNDLTFALRNVSDPQTIADYINPQVSRTADDD